MSGRKKLLLAGAVLVALLLANLWIRRPTASPEGFRPSAPREFDAGMRARIDEAITALPQNEQAEARRKVEETAAFFESVKALPDAERMQKVREHFRENPLPFLGLPGPPPQGGEGGGAPAADGAGGGGPGSGHIPPPEERYSMDQNIATEQEKAKAP